MKEAKEKLKSREKEKINLTDNDAKFQKDKGRIIAGYRGELAVDSDNQVIVANDVTNDQNDVPCLMPMVEQVLGNAALIQGTREWEPIKVCADAGYSSGRNLTELGKENYRNKIDPYIPRTKTEGKKRGKGQDVRHDVNSPFHRSKFVYNERENSFTCPSGKTLHYIRENQIRGVKYSLYQNYDGCRRCKYFVKCTNNKNGRSIWISEYQPLIEKMEEKLRTENGKKIYGKRKWVVEPVIGNISYNLGFREFLLRGKDKVRGEFSLICIGHNLLKIRTYLKRYKMSLKDLLIYKRSGVKLGKDLRIREGIILFSHCLNPVKAKILGYHFQNLAV